MMTRIFYQLVFTSHALFARLRVHLEKLHPSFRKSRQTYVHDIITEICLRLIIC